MKRIFLSLILTAATLPWATAALAQKFEDNFENKTLRLDYIVAGDSVNQAIYFEQAYSNPTWAGRKTRLDEKFLNGNGQVTVYEHGTNKVLYVNTFSTLFQEWQLTQEAKHLQKSFESSFLVPFPKKPVDVSITLSDTHQKVTAELRHTINPQDILIRPLGENGIPYRYIVKSGEAADCVDLAIIAEGYRQDQMDKFYQDAQRAADAIFEREPFASLKSRFNVVAVAAPSLDEGPSIPHEGKWKNTMACSHYDTFYSNRYLTTSKIHRIYDALSNVPFEQIIVLVNSPTYGGGGIYNQVTLSTSDHPTFKKVLVHEFGHGYAGLGDEYSTDEYDPMYPSDTEPWEPNLTTLKNFQSIRISETRKSRRNSTKPSSRLVCSRGRATRARDVIVRRRSAVCESTKWMISVRFASVPSDASQISILGNNIFLTGEKYLRSQQVKYQA